MIKSIIVDKYSEQILELLDKQEEFTRSDLQGIADAIVMGIIADTEKEQKHTSPTN